MKRLASLLCGEWTDGAGGERTLEDAATGEGVATVASGGLDLGAAVAWGRRVGGASLRAMSFAERAAVLKAMAGVVHEQREHLIDVSRQGGTTRGDAKFDIDGASGTLSYYAYLGKTLGDRKVLLDGEAEPVLRSKRFVGQHVRFSRRGIAVHINAFNFPAWGMAEKAAVSLLAGVPLITKPGTATSMLTHRIVELWHEAGILPEGSVQLLMGGVGDLLDHLGPQDVVAFTGGSETAASIRRHPNLVKHNVALNIEADSLNAAVLGPDIEVGSDTFFMFVNDVVRDMTQKCGQKCTAVRRIFVPTHLADAVQEHLADQLGRNAVGDPEGKDTRVGPVASRSQHRSVQAGIAALEAATTKVWQGEIPDGAGFFVRPSLFRSDAGLDTAYVHEHEVFGPVATILTWPGDVDGLVDLVAAGGGGLVCSVYSDEVGFGGDAVSGLAPWHGRILWGSKKVHDQSPGPGTVLPSFIHGGPGKAGGGSELGGLRGLELYMPRTAIQADQGLLKRVFGE
ncbi:MAG: 3,4-dehydroadipyl-CoA semialdehyde dehydrogenase [Alphaproteobacteria bacterium]|nr:3,4-dehydroadipyl-CoA semialdehyde dehydrogenase [Alphaproteobacteria bacterium]MCB9692145.1 3,4-dehydroadipyl-CoA semialdehyde dehydrogenase [Alphaproteobacteria bacterium]